MFGNILNIKTSKEKKFFIEKIKIYTKLINLSVNKYKLNFTNKDISEVSFLTNIKLNELGIFSKEKNDHKRLMDILSKNLYYEFINAINLNILHNTKINKFVRKLDPSQREKSIYQNKNKGKLKLVDLFCGAGGLSLGFGYEGFDIVLANDIDEECIQTYKYNHPEIPENKIVLGDIKDLIKSLDKYNLENVDVVAGGPPCQGFSNANQQRVIDDPRNELYKYFIDVVKKINPKIIVMENVKGMLSCANQVADDFQQISIFKNNKNYTYDVDYKILSSDNFGVAQKRERIFFIAVRNDICKSLDLSASKIFIRIQNSSKALQSHTLKDALSYIKPLEAPNIKNMTEIDDEKTGKKIDINKFNGMENSYLRLINRSKDISFISNHKARYVNEINRKIYSLLDQGDDGTNHKISEIMPYKHRNHIFKDKYFKLYENKPSKTITAHLKMDCHSHIHPNQTRSITPREAARIQSFPDDYFFLGPYLKTYMQIGNAVPPILAKYIAKEIKKILS